MDRSGKAFTLHQLFKREVGKVSNGYRTVEALKIISCHLSQDLSEGGAPLTMNTVAFPDVTSLQDLRFSYNCLHRRFRGAGP